ncbi:heat shock 70 kDa protein 12B-like [Mercenaria mercenaria]|uniref:heat shock 70 kDa protein 12B-like n=1 Tax=Mercenaria mercenaria TaxID=6596 RepID=UPI00234F2CBC|nr:heat shock 70 kDa protein 12B-like [Mercenaria mercenaria]
MAAATSKQPSKKKRLFVAAIDLGTTYSGWAYSTLNDPDKVLANQAWFAGTGTLASQKTPSCVLLSPKKEFEAFGYEAETKFAGLAEEGKHHGWYYFRRFKMTLFDDRKLNRHTSIEDISGKKMPALVIFAHAIRYLKNNFMQTVHNRVQNVKDTDVNYVLTVPAIWNDMAKRFMREAAIEAGIPNDQITLALEPEAASIWCQGIHTEVQRNFDTTDLGISAVGTRYMIVDLGGGTADITVHEKRHNNTLLEIHKATGGAWGGTEVDKNYIQLLAKIIGPNEWKKYEQKELEDILDIHRDFETKKRNISTISSGQITVKMPSSLKDAYEHNGKRSISDVEERFNRNIDWKKDKLRVAVTLMKKCFEGPVNDVIAHVEEILSEENMGNVDKIMLVGGFAESPYVQETFKAHFTGRRIIIPSECGLAVLKGAVLFGQNPTVVTARIARYTYGLEIAVPFDRTKHSREKLVDTDAGPLCRDSFWKAVEIGQVIKNGHEVPRIGRAVDDYQPKISLKIVKSKQRNPAYTTDPDCEVIGHVVIPMDRTLKADNNAVDEIFTFGGTELMLRTRHKNTGATQELAFDL